MTSMSTRERLMTAFGRGVPDRVPCHLNLTRWTRYHNGCACPRHLLRTAEEFGLDPLVTWGAYTWQSASNDYVYAPGGGYAYSASGLYGDLPGVNVSLDIENQASQVLVRRRFRTPAGELRDAIQWARPDVGYGDGPNPHRLEPLVKSSRDVEALAFLYPQPRRDLLSDIPLALEDFGERAVLAAFDCTHAGSWGMEPLGPEGMLLASIDDPPLLREVVGLAQRVHIRNLRAMLERGLEVVYDSWFQCGTSVGWSTALYREFFLPLVREATAVAHEYGALYIYQDDGRMLDVIPLAVEAGVDVVSGLQPPPLGDAVLAEVKREFGERVALMGGLDPVYSFDLGDPQRAGEAVRQAIRDAAGGGGYVVGLAEAVDPARTTAQTIRATAEAVRSSGVYGGSALV